MKTNADQRRSMRERAARCRHEMFSSDVLALHDDLLECLELLSAMRATSTDAHLCKKVDRLLRGVHVEVQGANP